MAIIQERRPDAPRPQVQGTDYGATYVSAGVESPVVKDVPVKEDVVVPSEQEEAQELPAVEQSESVVKKRVSVRPRKYNKKK